MYKNFNDLRLTVQEAFSVSDTAITIHKHSLVAKHVDGLVQTAIYSSDAALRVKAQRIIEQIAQQLNIYLSSLRPVYKAFAEGAIKGFATPVFHNPILSYDVARVIFRVAERQNAATFLFALDEKDSAKFQLSAEGFRTAILAAAIREQYSGPVFLQGIHKAFDPQAYGQDKDAELQRKKDWLSQVLHSGVYNVSINASGLVDRSLPSHHAQQKTNAHVTAILTDFIRKELPEKNVMLGACLGNARENPMTESLETFMTQYLYQIPRNSGISAIAVFEDTETPIDFTLLRTVSAQAKSVYKIGTSISRDISLQTPFFSFVTAEAIETHFQEAFRQILLMTMPADVKAQMGPLTDPFNPPLELINNHLWELPTDEKQPMITELEKYVTMVFEQLHVANTRDVVNKYVGK